MRAFLAGAGIQLRFLRAYPDSLIPFITAPLFTIIFMMIFRHAGRSDLTAYAAIAPVSVLPAWLRPLSAAIFLSWSADLLRAALRPVPVHELGFRLGMVALLGACGFAVGAWAMRVVLTRVRGSGELGTM